jgi:hypothetical protein
MSMTKQLLESVYERRKQQDNEFKQAEFEYYYGTTTNRNKHFDNAVQKPR